MSRNTRSIVASASRSSSTSSAFMSGLDVIDRRHPRVA
jgi:hypothetical protein